MKGTKTAIAASIVAILALSTPASASRYYQHKHYYTYHRHLHHQYSRHLTNRHWRYAHSKHSDLSSAPCHWQAKSMGGPCGCETAWKILGVAAHVWRGHNVWLAWAWSDFPRAIPVNGTAAVWRNHSHVAPILYANNDGTVTVKDYWAVHKVSLAQVIVVDPHPPIKAGYSYSAVPL